MKLPDELAGRLPKGEYTFRFTILNGEVKVISVTANGQELSGMGRDDRRQVVDESGPS